MDTKIKYGGFFLRFAAFWLDGIILLPLIGVQFLLQAHYRLFNAYYLVPGLCLSLFYSVYLVKRFGGTPGKLILGLRIVKKDGLPVGYREAFLRFLPELLLGEAAFVALILSTLRISDSEYLSLAFAPRSKRLAELAPGWYSPVHALQMAWVWSEFIVLLTNEKRRALQDYLAGTMVIVKQPTPEPEPPSLSPES